MSVVRVSKTRNYTVMSNFHLRDKNLSLKAKGLLSVMLSLPDDWDYSISGLASICGEGETTVKSAMKELNTNGYVSVQKLYPHQTESGKIEYEYHVFEEPDLSRLYTGKTSCENVANLTESRKQDGEKQGVEFLPLEDKALEIKPLLNTDTKNGTLNTEENSSALSEKASVLDTPQCSECQKVRVDYQRIVQQYNEICSRLPIVTKISEKRKSAINARLRTGYTEEDFVRAFHLASESRFLCGGNDKNWTADFDWIVRDSNMAKILDGKYSEERKKKNELGSVPGSTGNSRWNLQSAVD